MVIYLSGFIIAIFIGIILNRKWNYFASLGDNFSTGATILVFSLLWPGLIPCGIFWLLAYMIGKFGKAKNE